MAKSFLKEPGIVYEHSSKTFMREVNKRSSSDAEFGERFWLVQRFVADSQGKLPWRARGTWDGWVASKEFICNSQECSILTKRVKQEASKDKQ